MGKVSGVKVFKIDNELAKEELVAKRISKFPGQGFEHSDIWLRRTQRTFVGRSSEYQYDPEIIAGSIRVVGKVVNLEIVPEKDAVLEKCETDTGSPVEGVNHKVENFNVIYQHIFSSQSSRQKKVLHACLDKSEKENSIDDAPTNEIKNKRL